MPFTPFHFGPGACIGLPLKKYIDLPVFLLANVVVDLEPLAVMSFGLDYPIHGYFHTFLPGALLGLIWALLAYPARGLFQGLMNLFRLPYKASLSKMIISAILGVWFHVLLDGLIYPDVRAFYPLKANPLAGLLSVSAMYTLCTISFIPAAILYILAVASFISRNRVAP